MSTDKGYTIIRDAYPPKPPKHEHKKPPLGDVDYGAMIRCECGAVFTLKRIHAHPGWFRTWPFYPEHPDFGFRALIAAAFVVGISLAVWRFWEIHS